MDRTKRCRRSISLRRLLEHRQIRLVETLLAGFFGGHIPSVQFLWSREVEQVLRIPETMENPATLTREGEAELDENIAAQTERWPYDG
jgi:hypothetical protein